MEPKEAIAAARAVAEEYHRAFNAADLEASRAILNYPSVRMASGTVRVWHDSDEYEIDWDTLRTQEGWHHSTLDEVEVVQAGHDKVHLAATFTRYRSDGKPYAQHRAIWIVTLVDGHWGIQCRSSYAVVPFVPHRSRGPGIPGVGF